MPCPDLGTSPAPAPWSRAAMFPGNQNPPLDDITHRAGAESVVAGDVNTITIAMRSADSNPSRPPEG